LKKIIERETRPSILIPERQCLHLTKATKQRKPLVYLCDKTSGLPLSSGTHPEIATRRGAKSKKYPNRAVSLL